MPDNDAMTRFIGGSPVAVAARLVLLSILVGVILAALGLDPRDILRSVQELLTRIWDMGFDAVRWLWRYFLLGAVLVVTGCIAAQRQNRHIKFACREEGLVVGGVLVECLELLESRVHGARRRVKLGVVLARRLVECLGIG